MPLYSSLVRHGLYPLSLWRGGELAQLRYFREFERTQYLSADALHELQWERLRRQLSHAYEHCAFYRERFESVGLRPEDVKEPEDLRVLQPVEKRDIQESGRDMVADCWPTSDLLPNQTGGSTGAPLAFYLSKDRKCSRAAATWRHNGWAGWKVGDRAAVIWGAPRDRPESSCRAWLRDKLLREPMWLDTASLTESAMAGFHRKLQRYRPRIVLAYARAAVLFARYLQACKLSAYRPHALVTSAEVLEPEERKLLEEVFGCPVFNRYGCREVSVVASECEAHAGLHVMAEGLYVEIEGPCGRAGPGEMGSILITDLLNQAMPLIRYRIGDMGSWATGKCACGRALPRLEQLAGRVTDFLLACDGRLVSGVFLATYVVAQRPSLGQVQIWQTRAGAITFRIKPGPDFCFDADTLYLRRAGQEYLGAAMQVETEIVPDLPHEPSGKFLFSRSSLTPAFLTVDS